jgi:hypothetical protein
MLGVLMLCVVTLIVVFVVKDGLHKCSTSKVLLCKAASSFICKSWTKLKMFEVKNTIDYFRSIIIDEGIDFLTILRQNINVFKNNSHANAPSKTSYGVCLKNAFNPDLMFTSKA